MRRAAAVCAGLLVVASCPAQDPAPAARGDLEVRVTAVRTDVEFGVAFAVTVACAWSTKLVPEEWSDDVLSPLVVELEDVIRREGEQRIEEERHYRAYVFRSGDVTVPAPFLRAMPRDGSAMRIAIGDELQLRVAPALDPEASADPELPGEPYPAPFSLRRWWGGGVLLIVAAALGSWFWRQRAARVGAVSAPPAVASHKVALAELARLRGRSPADAAEIHADAVAVSSVLREYLAQRFGVCGPELTTEEFLSAPATAHELPEPLRERLGEILDHGDLVKFAALVPASVERERWLAAIETFVRETAEEAGSS